MESFVITWRELLIVVAAVLAIYVAELLLLLRANKTGEPGFNWRRSSLDKVFQSRLENLEIEVADLRQQITQLETGMARVELPSTAPPPPPPLQTPYSQAIQLAQSGLDADAVASSCGISRGEAELIVAMHRARSP